MLRERLDERGIARMLEMSEYLVREYLGMVEEWKQEGEVNA
jgi:DNA-binding GntR family transcriptional regulator